MRFFLLHDKEDNVHRQFGDLLPRVIMVPAESIDEVIVSLLENAPDTVRKRVEKYLTSLVPLVLQMITDLEDDEKWSVSYETADDNTSDNNMIGKSA